MWSRREQRRSRRFWIIAAVVGLFLVFDLALFSWWVFRSLSQRELDRVLVETRQEAQELAARIAVSAERTHGDLYTAVALEQETLAYIDSVLTQRSIVQTLEITDRDGLLVMRKRSDEVPTSSEGARSAPSTSAPPSPELGSLDVTVPIGSYGRLRIGLSANEMDHRIAQLRLQLLRQTAIIGGVTGIIVIGAVAFISILIRRGERLETQAEEAARLAYLGTLAAGLAHEIRNPLNSLNLNMQLLEEDLGAAEGAESSRRLLTITRAEIGRLERLVSGFLAYARPRALQLEETPAIDLLIAVREVLATQIARTEASVRMVDESYEASVRVDAEQMRQLLINLVQNALSSTEGTGRKPEVTLFARREGERVEIEVRDNGRGIAPAERDRIFEAFYSTRKGGTGLGLAIAQRIALAHGGTITVDSDLEYGTKFVLSLPMVAAQAGAAGGS